MVENLSSLDDVSRVSVCIDRNEEERKVMNELVQSAKQKTNESSDKKVCCPYIREINEL